MQSKSFDLLLKHGRVIDPAQDVDARLDVGFADGKVRTVGADLPEERARQVIDVSHCLVVPGLIDLHVHALNGFSHFGVDPDATCLARGVTTALDAGSAGAATFPGFRRYIIDACQTRLFALLNVSSIGLVIPLGLEPPTAELEDMRWLDSAAAIKMVEAHRDRLLGVKIRLTEGFAANGKNEAPGLRIARQTADALDLPLMVHTPNSTLAIESILDNLRPGDVLTHCFHGHRCGILDKNGEVLADVRKAIDRGILLDVGHGMGSFSWDTARRALDQGIVPFSISTDIHRYNVEGPVFDMPTTLSKFLHLGMSISEVIRLTTAAPARFLKRETEIGSLRADACGDCAVFRMVEGQRPLTDTFGKTENAERWLAPRLVVRAGEVVAEYDDDESTRLYPDVEYQVVARIA